MKKILFATLAASSVFVSGSHVAVAQEAVTAEEATRKVNIAGRQRMLSQRMAKAACLLSQEIDSDVARAQLSAAYDLFVASDRGLRQGSADLGLPVENDAEVLTALEDIDPHWLSYRLIIQDVIGNGAVPREELALLDQTSLQVLKFMDIAVFQTASAYSDVSEALPLNQTVTVDIAGRQRMLTQRAVKEACMMRIADDPAVYAQRIAETANLFDLSLTALQVGYEQVGVMAAPTPAIAEKLAQVRGLWLPVKAMLDRAAGGEVLSVDDLAALARETEPLLNTMNEAVGLYEDIPT